MFKFIACLTVVFIVLKITNTVKWKWVWVLSPMWIMLILLAAVFVAALILCLLY